jgi:hypothetical protein
MDAHRYNITVTFTPTGTAPTASVSPLRATRRVGFRHFALVTGNDTDPAYIEQSATAEGSGTLGMVWKVNGKAVMARGANQIPMEVKCRPTCTHVQPLYLCCFLNEVVVIAYVCLCGFVCVVYVSGLCDCMSCRARVCMGAGAGVCLPFAGARRANAC